MLRALRERGVLGINRRNIDYTMRWNDRRRLPLVDDKLATKRLCLRAGIPVPELLAVAHHHFELRALLAETDQFESFVLKPVRGAMGNGVVVVTGRRGEALLRSGGREFTGQEFLYHAAGIVSGLYSLAGHRDSAMVEERLVAHPDFVGLATDGVPDVRLIVYRGVPVMAMTRLPTRVSDGRANLHQGAIGAGVDIATGRTHHAVLRGYPIAENPDSGLSVLGRLVPEFDRVLEIAVRATDATGLGYVGADVVVDAQRGPVVLELNARPGLSIQLANRRGLRALLDRVDEHFRPDLSVYERVKLGGELAQVED